MSFRNSQTTFEADRARYVQHVSAHYPDFLSSVGLDLDIAQAFGATVIDKEGRRYVDCIAGYGNLNLGHNHPRVIEAVVTQLQAAQPFNWPFRSPVQARLAERLADVCPGDLECSLVVNSGAEAVDSAIKLTRLTTGKPHLIAMHGAWHGFTLGAMSVSETSMTRKFAPLLPEVTLVPYGDLDAVERAINQRTGGVLIEPIQAEGGAIVPPAGFMRALRQLCSRRGIWMIVDEIKTGMGKTGKLLACEHEGVVPDLLLLGKSLGGGVVSMGVLVGRRPLWGKLGLSFPMAASSGAGTTVACAAALATLETLDSERLVARAWSMGERLRAALGRLVSRFPQMNLRLTGLGLLTGLHLPSSQVALRVVRRCVESGVLVMFAFCNRSCLLIEPPLVVNEDEIDLIAESVSSAVAAEASGPDAFADLRSLSNSYE